jgi:hypothetical protein
MRKSRRSVKRSRRSVKRSRRSVKHSRRSVKRSRRSVKRSRRSVKRSRRSVKRSRRSVKGGSNCSSYPPHSTEYHRCLDRGRANYGGYKIGSESSNVHNLPNLNPGVVQNFSPSIDKDHGYESKLEFNKNDPFNLKQRENPVLARLGLGLGR